MLVDGSVELVFLEKLGMVAVRDNATAIKNNDLVGIFQHRQAMGGDDADSLAKIGAKGLNDLLFRFLVNCGQGIVKNQNRWIKE